MKRTYQQPTIRVITISNMSCLCDISNIKLNSDGGTYEIDDDSEEDAWVRTQTINNEEW